MDRVEYIRMYRSAIVDSVRGTNLFPSVMMAQAIVESGNGNSILAATYNNHFGINAGTSWKGATISLDTREVYYGREGFYKGAFRVYPTVLGSFKDRNTFLTTNLRYAKAGVFTAATPEEQARALQKAGYATDPQYANILIGLIRNYNLKELDEDLKKNESAN